MLSLTKHEKIGLSVIVFICIIIVSITLIHKSNYDNVVIDTSFTNNHPVVLDTQNAIKDRISSLGYKLDYTHVRDNIKLGDKSIHSFCSVFNTNEDIVELCYTKNHNYFIKSE